jgi:hypothetical protein
MAWKGSSDMPAEYEELGAHKDCELSHDTFNDASASGMMMCLSHTRLDIGYTFILLMYKRHFELIWK